jgi:hypothetical protein
MKKLLLMEVVPRRYHTAAYVILLGLFLIALKVGIG